MFGSKFVPLVLINTVSNFRFADVNEHFTSFLVNFHANMRRPGLKSSFNCRSDIALFEGARTPNHTINQLLPSKI